MHTPSMITPLLANAVLEEHAREARARRFSRRGGPGRLARRRSRRQGGADALLR